MRKKQPPITIEPHEAMCVVVARRQMERASFYMQLADEAASERGRWRRTHLAAVHDAVWNEVNAAIRTLDGLASKLEEE